MQGNITRHFLQHLIKQSQIFSLSTKTISWMSGINTFVKSILQCKIFWVGKHILLRPKLWNKSCFMKQAKFPSSEGYSTYKNAAMTVTLIGIHTTSQHFQKKYTHIKRCLSLRGKKVIIQNVPFNCKLYTLRVLQSTKALKSLLR